MTNKHATFFITCSRLFWKSDWPDSNPKPSIWSKTCEKDVKNLLGWRRLSAFDCYKSYIYFNTARLWLARFFVNFFLLKVKKKTANNNLVESNSTCFYLSLTTTPLRWSAKSPKNLITRWLSYLFYNRWLTLDYNPNP